MRTKRMALALAGNGPIGYSIYAVGVLPKNKRGHKRVKLLAASGKFKAGAILTIPKTPYGTVPYIKARS